jgi:hypothetical protein
MNQTSHNDKITHLVKCLKCTHDEADRAIKLYPNNLDAYYFLLHKEYIKYLSKRFSCSHDDEAFQAIKSSETLYDAISFLR